MCSTALDKQKFDNVRAYLVTRSCVLKNDFDIRKTRATTFPKRKIIRDRVPPKFPIAAHNIQCVID